MTSYCCSFTKRNRVQIGVFQHKPQTDRLAGELFEVTAALPRHYLFGLVAVDLRTICQSMAWQWESIRVLKFHLNATSGLGGKIQHQSHSGENKCIGIIKKPFRYQVKRCGCG